ncbi:hypothetical protein G7054_g8445 [Neopestalotiopsis clavispora]|nr:hypothetical protein G7054_g8445 [Neopestalotiopsis clavispora]
MRKNLFLGAVALSKFVLARGSTADAENGIWYLSRDVEGNLNLTTRVNFEYKPEPSKHHLVKRQSPSQDDHTGRPEQDLWPWKQSGSSSSDDTIITTTSTKSPRSRLNPQRPPAATTDGDTPTLPVKQYDCGNLQLDPVDAYYAKRMLAAYCAAVGSVDAYQHLASKYGSVIVYICARGHPETCTSADVMGAMQWLDSDCSFGGSSSSNQVGWVYNNYVHPLANAPANKYGRDEQGANFC